METSRLRGRNIAFINPVISLGIFLDPKLNWKQNLTERRKKFYSSMWACRRVMGKTYRINSNIVMWMYKTVLLPQILYASVVWWCVVSRVKAKNLQRSLQRSYPGASIGSVKTPPTEALEVALCLTPLDLAVIGAARYAAYRLSCKGEWRNVGLGHMKLKFLQKYPFTLKQNRILKKYHW